MPQPAELLGESPEIVAVRERIRQLLVRGHRAGRLPPILVEGETGTGKGLLAHLIHREGVRRSGPFVDVNCAAIPEPLLEAELFGFERGAFTDARQPKPGLFQVAHGGTMFLDEIGLLPEGLQGKLLKVIEERAVRRLGGTRTEPVDVSIVAASGEDLAAASRSRRFRPDLYHRISVVTVRLPPLRERRGDILLLADHFLGRATAEYGLPAKTLAADARRALVDHPWPGNVRELCNVMERVALLTESAVVTAGLLALGDATAAAPDEADARERPLGHEIEEMEQARIADALKRTGGNVSQAAARLRMSRDKLRYRIEKYGLHAAAPRRRRTPPAAAPRPGPASGPPDAPRPAATIQWGHRLLAVLGVTLAVSGPAEVWTELSRPLEVLVDKVRSFGGRVEELSPRGVVAVFGLGGSGDAAAHAAFAALAIQQAATRAAPADAPRVTAKAAIHSGRFLVGLVSGAPQVDVDAKRQATTVLDGLLARAELGGVVVSAATAPFLDRRFELVRVDGGDEAGAAYRLAARKGGAFSGRLTTFVGRGHELALLHGRLASAVQGQGQAVAVIGEPGIGKSRLLHELRESLATADSPRFVQAHCFSFGTDTPYLPLMETLRTLCGLAETDSAAATTEKVRALVDDLGLDAASAPYLLDLLGVADGRVPPAAPGSDILRTRTFDTLRAVYLAVSRERPLILAVEDLHWVDRTTEEFLASLVDVLPGARLLLVVTYRAGYRPPWGEQSYASQIALPPLSPEESRGLLYSVLSADQLPPALAPVILARAEGNPFFLEELARVVARGGGTIVVPDTVQDVLMARLEQLAPAPRAVLQVASVYGREVSVALLGDVWSGPGALDVHLRQLVQREFVSLRSTGETTLCTFTHALTQEVAYRSLPDGIRRRLHERVARALSARAPGIAEAQPEVLAQHLTSAGLAAEAVGYWLLAGQQARGRSAYAEAINHLTRGLEVLGGLPASPERAEQEIALQLALGASLGPRKGFGSPEAAEAYTRARQLCQEVGPSPRLFNALLGLVVFDFARGELHRARDVADQCLDLAATLDDSSMRCRASNAMGGVLVHVGEPAAARAHLERAIDLVPAAADRPVPYHSSVTHPLVFALAYDAWALWLLGHPDRGLQASEDALRFADDLGHPHTRALALHHANVFRRLRADADVILPRAERLIAMATEHGFPGSRALGMIMRGCAVAEQGRFDEGLAEIERGLAAYRETGTEVGRPYFLGLLAAARARAGRVEDALRAVDEAFTLADARHEHAWDAELHRRRGQLLADALEDAAGAERSFREAIAVARHQHALSLELRATLALGRLLARDGRRAEASAMIGEVYGRFTEGFGSRDLVEARAWLEQAA